MTIPPHLPLFTGELSASGSELNVLVNQGNNTLVALTSIAALVTGALPASAVSTDGTMAADSDALVPSQKAVVTYVASQLPAAAIPLSYLDTDGTMASDSDTKVPSQKAVVTYVAANAGSPAQFDNSDTYRNVLIASTVSGYGLSTTLTIAAGNVAIGAAAFQSAVTASGCICIGQSAGGNITTGTFDTIIGDGAGYGIVTGSGNIIIGHSADISADDTNHIVIGTGITDAGGSNSINIGGVFTVTGIDTPSTSAAVLAGTLAASNLSGSNTGDQTLPIDSTLTVTDNTGNNVSTTAHGFAPKAPNDATKYLDGTGAYSVPAGGGGPPVVFGKTASIGDFTSVYFGRNTGAAHETTNDIINTGVGSRALASITSGTYNTAVGFEALDAISSGSRNAAFGAEAYNGSGSDNTAIGYNAGNGATTGGYNVFVGRDAGTGVTSGGSNTLIGHNAGGAVNGGSNNTVIGAGVSVSSPSSSDEVVIGTPGGAIFTTTGAGTPSTSVTTVAGTLTVTGGMTGAVAGTVTITTAAVTISGATGSMTFTNGILTAHTDAT